MSLTVVSVLLLLPLCHVTYFILLLPVFWTLLALPHRHIQPPAWILGCTAFVYLTLTCNLACDMSGQHLNSILMAGLRFFSLLFLWMLVVLAVWHELRRLSVAPNRSGHTTEGPMTSVGTIQSTVE